MDGIRGPQLSSLTTTWVAGLLLLICSGLAQANSSPVGLWKTVDDKTGQEKSLVRISDSAGALSGRVEKLFHPSRPNPTCDKCSDARRGKPVVGIVLFDGLKRDGDVWDGGQILDPENGKLYTVRLRPSDDGKSLQVRGYIGPFFRTQTWERIE